MSTPAPLVIGDKVKMDLSGSPTMILAEIVANDGKCWCWISDDNKFYMWVLPLCALKKA